jgi:hypothetical protein
MRSIARSPSGPDRIGLGGGEEPELDGLRELVLVLPAPAPVAVDPDVEQVVGRVEADALSRHGSSRVTYQPTNSPSFPHVTYTEWDAPASAIISRPPYHRAST